MIRMAGYLVGIASAAAVTVFVLGGIPNRKEGDGNLSKIETTGLAAHGVEIVGPADASFKTLVSEQAQTKGSPNPAALKSSSVFIVNRSRLAIAALNINWELSLPDGTKVSHATAYKSGLGVVSDGDSPHLMDYIARNGSRPFSLLDSSNGANPGIGTSMGGGGNNKARQLSEAVKVTVSVDGVLFVDGTFVGPDTKDFFGLLKAEIDARRDLVEDIAQMLDGDAEATKRFELMANAKSHDNQDQSGNNSYYNMIKETQASVISARRKRFGDKALLEAVKVELSKPRMNLRKLQSN
ncbi:MAG: hypothetical protein AABO41_19560 [Acidobacteriota bacterium]